MQTKIGILFMAELTKKEIQILNKEIEKGGLTYTQLQKELLDHLCCSVEDEMDKGFEFIKALKKVRSEMGRDSIRQIQEDTLLLINQKYRAMKKLMYLLGTIAPTLLIIGTIFKIQHWPGAGIMLVISLFLLGAIYLPVFVSVKIRDTRKEGKPVNMPMYIFGLIAGIVFIAGAMFKIMHWPGAGIMVVLSAIVTVAVFIPILVIQAIKDKENQVQNFTVLIFVMSFVAITFMMSFLRVSKNVLDSFFISIHSNMNTLELVESRNASYIDMVNSSSGLSAEVIDQTKELKEKTDALNDYIQKLIGEIAIQAHPRNLEAVDENGNIDFFNLFALDNLKSVNMVMFGGEENEGKGMELKTKIDEYRNFAINLLDPEQGTMIEKLLDTSPTGDYDTPWLHFYFSNIPMIASLNLLSDIQINLRFIENEVLGEIMHTSVAQPEMP